MVLKKGQWLRRRPAAVGPRGPQQIAMKDDVRSKTLFRLREASCRTSFTRRPKYTNPRSRCPRSEERVITTGAETPCCGARVDLSVRFIRLGGDRRSHRAHRRADRGNQDGRRYPSVARALTMNFAKHVRSLALWETSRSGGASTRPSRPRRTAVPRRRRWRRYPLSSRLAMARTGSATWISIKNVPGSIVWKHRLSPMDELRRAGGTRCVPPAFSSQ